MLDKFLDFTAGLVFGFILGLVFGLLCEKPIVKAYKILTTILLQI